MKIAVKTKRCSKILGIQEPITTTYELTVKRILFSKYFIELP